MTQPLRIGIVLDSTRTGRFADRPAEWLFGIAKRRARPPAGPALVPAPSSPSPALRHARLSSVKRAAGSDFKKAPSSTLEAEISRRMGALRPTPRAPTGPARTTATSRAKPDLILFLLSSPPVLSVAGQFGSTRSEASGVKTDWRKAPRNSAAPAVVTCRRRVWRAVVSNERAEDNGL